MNTLAGNLNKILEKTEILSMLSDFGKRMYVPNGIIVQSTEAKKKASKYNATIGVALEHGTAMYLPSVKAQFAETMTASEIFPYAPMGGVLSLRERWQKEMIVKNPALEGKKFSLPVVCSGLTNALSIVCSLFLDKDDSVVCPSMYWENYNLILDEQRQVNKVLFDNFDGDGFNLQGFDNAISSVQSDKVAVILNFPNNPTGYTPTNYESDKIAEILKKHADNGKKIVVICDDAYFGLFFDKDVCTQSLFAKICDASPNLLAIKCDAATKENMVWGFRVAFITYGFKGCDDETLDVLMKKTMGTIRGSFSNCSMSGQQIILKSMDSPNYATEKQVGVDKIAARYAQMKKALLKYADNDCLRPFPFNSGYFMSFETKCKAEDLRQELLNNWGTGTICLGEHLLRIAFSSVDLEDIDGLVDTLFEAAQKIC